MSDEILNEVICASTLLFNLGITEGEFANYMEYLRQHDKSYQCHTSIEDRAIAVFCTECSRSNTALTKSCICVPCYLKSNHEGHNVSYHVSESFTCDCGNPFNWDLNNSCSDHHKGKDEGNTLKITPEELNKLEKAIQESIFETCCPFSLFIKLANVGNGVAMLISKNVLEKMDFAKTLREFGDISMTQARNTINFWCSMIIENDFCLALGEAFLDYCIDFIDDSSGAAYEDRIIAVENYKMLASAMFHFLTEKFIVTTKRFTDPDANDLVGWIKGIMKALLRCYDLDIHAFHNARIALITATYMSAIFEQIITNEKTKHLTDQIVRIAMKYAYKFELKLQFKKIIGDYDNDEEGKAYVCYRLIGLIYSIFEVFARNHLINEKFLDLYFDLVQEKFPYPEDEEYYGSVLDGSTPVTFCLPFHCAICFYLWENVDNAKAIMENFASQHNVDFDLVCRHFAIPIIRHFAGLLFIYKGCFKGTSEHVLRAMALTCYPDHFKDMVFPLFVGIQIMFAITNDKSKFLQMIWDTFNNGAAQDYREEVESAFIYFLGCLLFERDILKRDEKIMKLISYSIQMKTLTKAKWTQVSYIWYGINDVDPDFLNITVKETTSAGTFYRLKDEQYCHTFVPWASIITILNMHSIITHNGESLLQMPDFTEISHYNLGEVFNDQFMEEIMYKIFDSKNLSAQHMAFAIVRQIKEVHEDLIEKIFESTGKIGRQFLISANLLKDEASKDAEQKHQVESIDQKAVMSKFMTNFMNISDSEEEEEEADEFCSKCQNGGNLSYPMYIFKSTVFAEIDETLCDGIRKEQKDLFQFAPCQHPIHSSCVTTNYYKCPMDNSRMNCVIPDLIDNEPIKMEDQINTFLERIQVRGSRFYNLLTTFCSHIGIFEVRFRSNPKAFGNNSFIIMINILYTMLKYVREKDQEPEQEYEDEFENIVAKYLLKDINSTEFVGKLTFKSDVRKFVIFRRIEILKQIIIAKATELDWSSILSQEELNKKYSLNLNNVELRQFSLNLPENYLDLFREPELKNDYYFDPNVFKMKVIQTGDVITNDQIVDYITSLKTQPVLLFVVNGQLATVLSVVPADPIVFSVKTPVYLNKFGDENVGLQSCGFMVLSKERCLECIDTYLSGEWSHQYDETIFF